MGKLKNTLIVSSILYFFLGIFMILFPEIISDFICYLVSLLFLFFGIASVLMYVRSEIKTPYTSTILVLGIILGSLGVYILLNPRTFASLIPLVIGVFMIADSISKLSAALDLRKYGYINWWHMLLMSFIILGCGLLLVFNPFEAISLTIMVIGFILIIDSLSNIYTIYSYSRAFSNKKLLNWCEPRLVDIKIEVF